MNPDLTRLVRYFLWLGTTGFGGPIALVGYMQRDLVERGWITEREYADGLAFSQLAPGPLAAQLAMYLGWARGRVLGATLTGAAFVLPSFLMVLALSVAYVRFGGIAWLRGAFYGVGAAVIAVLARSAVKLVRLTLGRDALLWLVFAVNAGVVAVTASESLWVFVASGVGVAALRRASLAPPAAAPTAALLVALPLLSGSPGHGLQLFWFFSKAGAVVFGSGLAIVPFLYGGVVEQYRWLGEREFLDAVAVSLVTPGPVVITVAFIGYLTAGLTGAVLAAVGVFLPVYLSVVFLAPSYARVAHRPGVRGFVDGVTAAATGAIAGSVVVLGTRAITDAVTAAVALAALVALAASRRVPDIAVILAAGVVGIALG